MKHRLKANEQRPAIEVVKQYGELPLVNCFPGPLNQVFMNLLANAIEALDESTQNESQNRSAQIAIATELKHEQVEIKIKDNGNGMPPDVQQRIFDYLFTTKSVEKGTGLGLAIVKQIVEEKHGGRIAVQSVLGEGTEFTLLLPLA